LEELIKEIILQFKATTWVEWFGTITGALCVYLAAKENIWNWPIAILSVTTYIYIFYNAQLYGDTFLQVYFLATCIYGWYYWTYGKSKNTKADRPVSSLKTKEWLIIAVLQIVLFLVGGYYLDTKTDTDVPYIDAFCTVGSLIAQYLLTRKIIENWIIWIVVDIIYIPLYIHKDLLATAVLYFIFLFIAAKGYMDWKKSLQKELAHG
jgi:nicotinamide mononucleotide transporter